MHSPNKKKLVSSETATLWATYISDSMAVCVFKHFLSNVQDTEIGSVVEYAMSLAQKHIQVISEILKNEGKPIPVGFTDDDVDISAPRLFSDAYYLYYLRLVGTLGLEAYGVALPLMVRQDILDFFTDCLQTTIELSRRISKVLLNNGLFISSPLVETSNEIDFIDNRNFLSGLSGEHRNLLATEITHLYANLESNVNFKTLLFGFSQVSKIPVIAEYMIRGKHLSEKHIDIIASTLKTDDVPAPTTWDNYISSSTIPPFSEKLMLFHVGLLCVGRFTTYATGLAASLRSDLQLEYFRLLAQISKFTYDGCRMMIDNGWLEQPPQAVKHDS
jgi:hypothetical protein